jgi:hypothetical protein
MPRRSSPTGLDHSARTRFGIYTIRVIGRTSWGKKRFRAMACFCSLVIAGRPDGSRRTATLDNQPMMKLWKGIKSSRRREQNGGHSSAMVATTIGSRKSTVFSGWWRLRSGEQRPCVVGMFARETCRADHTTHTCNYRPKPPRRQPSRERSVTQMCLPALCRWSFDPPES